MSAVLLSNEFNESNVSFSEPKKNQMGGQNVLISYNNNGRSGPLVIQTPRLRAPFGASEDQPEGGGPVKYSVNLTLNNEGNTGKFFNLIKNLETCVKNASVEHSEKWFGKKKSLDVIEELNRSVIKYPKNDKYDPTIKIKLPYNEKGPQFSLEDENKINMSFWVDGKMDLSSIPKGAEMTAIIQCTGIYFIGKSQFGIGFKILKARVYAGNQLQNISIIDDDEEQEPYEDY